MMDVPGDPPYRPGMDRRRFLLTSLPRVGLPLLLMIEMSAAFGETPPRRAFLPISDGPGATLVEQSWMLLAKWGYLPSERLGGARRVVYA
jgi:hypothetical protein